MARNAVVVAVLALVVGSALGAGTALTVLGPATPTAPAAENPDEGTDSAVTTDDRPADENDAAATETARLSTFENASAFETYVRRGNLLVESNRPTVRFQARTDDMVIEEDVATMETADTPANQASGDGGDGGGSTAPSRVANTNVQVEGLDEPDIVKTDGRHFYYAPQGRLSGPRPLRNGGSPDEVKRVIEHARGDTHVLDVTNPQAPEQISSVDTTGKLLQTGQSLLVIERAGLTGYDVSDPEDPQESWSLPLNGTLVTAREQNGTIYVVTETPAGPGACPIEPMGADHAIACEDIYRPGTQIPVDATYTAFAIDAENGEIQDTVSFVGTARNSVVYVSGDALYVTYTEPENRAAVMAEFLREEFDRTPDHLVERIDEIQSYDITPASKQREIRRAFDRWVTTLPPEEREQVRESFHEGFTDYVGTHQRELSRTGIVKVELASDSMTVEATGTVPGRPLNQFSMDQHNGTLRIATTVPGLGSADSENDLYTLDSESLTVRGNETNMGTTERIYSVRYVGDTAYVVTFRRVDPFHVVDLSDPSDPEELGKLKLPGFSSYLHPVDDDHVLGIGEENGKVKTVLFDVSDPSNPEIADSKVLDQQWSAVAETHHAFLMDRKHGVFVLPAGERSLVFDYTGGELERETTIETADPASRARYVEDSLYVFAGDAVTVVNETTWERTTTLELDG